jgi:uncharacterized RDD family membrane protein YckC
MASAEYSVLTPERVSLQYDIAGIGSRGAAAIVDTVIQAVGMVVWFIAISTGVGLVGYMLGIAGSQGGTALLVAMAVLGVFVITGGYFMLFEIIWNGQTPGKRLLGVRVIRENGYPIRPVDAVIRNLVRMVDWLPMGYGIGVLTMLLNGRSKRLGDFASGTIVVREGRSLSAASFLAPSETRNGHTVTLSNADASLVRDFLTRRSTMQAQARAELARRLAEVIGQRYGLGVAANPEAFLENLGA